MVETVHTATMFTSSFFLSSDPLVTTALSKQEMRRVFPFSISSTLWDGLCEDALRFSYQQRSGIAINGSLVGDQFARAAGHVQAPPNTEDVRVLCKPITGSLIAYLEPWPCSYTLD